MQGGTRQSWKAELSGIGEASASRGGRQGLTDQERLPTLPRLSVRESYALQWFPGVTAPAVSARARSIHRDVLQEPGKLGRRGTGRRTPIGNMS